MEGLSAEQWQALKIILDEALEIPESKQEAFLQEKLGTQAKLLAEARAFLAADKAVYQALEEPFRFTWGGVAKSDEEVDLIGTMIGDYRLLERIGSGGMGVVYRASRMIEDAEQIVAIKILKRGTDTEEVVRRFRHERRILAGLNHPHIAKLLDGGSTTDGLPYLVMEYVDGEPLFEYCRSQQLDLRARLKLFQKICMAVHFAHQNLVVHRDLKPSNIMVTSAGEPKLLDFGIAKWLSPGVEKSIQMTRKGLQVMTPEYASPEQFLDEAITTASDIYVLGILFYEIVAGVRHISLDTRGYKGLKEAVCRPLWVKPSARLSQAIARGLEKLPVLAEAGGHDEFKARRRVRHLRGDLDNIARMAMQRDPSQRYDSAMQLSGDIDRYLEGRVILARPETLGYLLSKLVTRHKMAVSFLGVLCFLILAFSGFAFFQHQRLVEQRDNAQNERQRKENLNEFLYNIFAAADPYSGNIGEITAKDLLDRAALNLQYNQELDPRSRAEYLETIGGLYVRLGLIANAEPLLIRAQKLKAENFSSDDRVFYSIHQILGDYYYQANDQDKAKKQINLALAGYEQVGDPDGSGRIPALASLGEIERLLGNYDLAIEHHQNALALIKDLQPDNGLILARQLELLGQVYYRHGDYRKALATFEEALAALPGKDTWPVQRADIMSEIGNVYRKLSKFASAEEIFRDSLKLRSRVFGPDSLRATDSYLDLGWLCVRRGRYREGEELLLKALEIRKRLLDKDHLKIAIALNHLAGLYMETGQFEESSRLYKEALPLRALQLGKCHTKYAELLSNLGQVALLRSALDEAEVYLEEAVQIRTWKFGKYHSDTARISYHLGNLRLAQGRYEEASQIFGQVKDVFEANIGPTSFVVGCSFMKLGEAYAHLKQDDLADVYLGEALKILFASGGPENPYTAEAYLVIGDFLLGRNNPADAAWWYSDAYDVLNEKSGPNYPKTSLAKKRLRTVRSQLQSQHPLHVP